MLGPIILNGLGFFTMSVFTRLLGTENYGVYTVYASYLSILSVLIGFQAAGAIAPVSVVYEKEERDRCFSNIMAAAVLSALLIGVLLLVFMEPLSSFTKLSKKLLAVLFFHAAGMFAVNFTTAKCSYDKNSFRTFLISVSVSVLSIGLALLFIFTLPASVPRYESYIYGHAIPYVLVGLGAVIWFLRKGKSCFDKRFWSFFLPLCLPLIFHQLSNTLLHQCDKIMLQKLTSDSIAGIYGFAVTFAGVMNIIWSALNTTFVPFYHDDVKAERFDLLRRKVRNYGFLFTCLTLGFVMAAPEVVKIFGSRDFWPATNVIPILALGYYFVFLYSFPVNFEFYHRKTKIIAVGTFAAAVLNIVLNYFLIPVWGMYGAAAATAASYALLWVFHMILAKLVIKETYHFPFGELYVYFGITAAGTACFYLIRELWMIRWGIFLVLAVLILWRIIKQKSIF